MAATTSKFNEYRTPISPHKYARFEGVADIMPLFLGTLPGKLGVLAEAKGSGLEKWENGFAVKSHALSFFINYADPLWFFALFALLAWSVLKFARIKYKAPALTWATLAISTPAIIISLLADNAIGHAMGYFALKN